MSVLVNKPSQLSAATGTSTVSVDLILLETKVNMLAVHPRWKDKANWKSVEFIYENATKQRYKIVFKIDQNKLSFVIDIPSNTRDGIFSCVDLNIAGYNSDFLEIDRSQFLSLFGSTSIFDINVIEGYGYVEPPPPPDTTAPFITSIIPPTNKNYITDEVMQFSVIFSEPVNVINSPSLTISRIGETSTYFTATLFSGNGTNTLVFRYTVQSTLSLTAPNGIEIRSPMTGLVRDAANNNAIQTFTNVQLPLVTVNKDLIIFETHSSLSYTTLPEYFSSTYQLISSTPRSTSADYYATLPTNPYISINQTYYDSSVPAYDIGKICAEVVRGADKYVLEQVVLSSTSVKIKVHRIPVGSNILNSATIEKELVINNFQVQTFAYNGLLTRGENLVRQGGIVHFIDNSTSCIFLMAKYNGTVNDTRYFLHTTDFVNWQYKKIQAPSDDIGPNIWNVQNWMSGRLLTSVDGRYVMLIEEVDGGAIVHSADGLTWQQRQFRTVTTPSPYVNVNTLHKGLTSTASYYEFTGVNSSLNFEVVMRLNKL